MEPTDNDGRRMKQIALFILLIFIILSSYFMSENKLKEKEIVDSSPRKRKSSQVKKRVSLSEAKQMPLTKPRLSREEVKEITEEVVKEFEVIEFPFDLPEDSVESYHLMSDAYLKTLSFLSEVNSSHVEASVVDVKKAFDIILAFSQDNDTDDVSGLLKKLSLNSPQLFDDALRELDQEQSALLVSIKDRDAKKPTSYNQESYSP